MADVLMSAMPNVGHVQPALVLAARLVQRGHRVRFHTGPQFASQVRTAGAEHVVMRRMPPLDELADRPGRGLLDLGQRADEMRRLYVDWSLDQVEDYGRLLEARPADVLVADVPCLGAMVRRELGGPPWASLGVVPLGHPSADAPPWQFRAAPATSALGRMRNRALHWIWDRVLLRGAAATANQRRAAAGLPPLGGTLSAALVSPYVHLQCTVASFEFPRRNLPDSVHFIGPLIPPPPASPLLPAWWPDLDAGRPVVHVTQGTVAIHSEDLVLPALHGLADDDVLVVVTTPARAPLGRLPANARLARFVPYQCLLPRVDVMVTNGGYGGVNMALAHGVPVVTAGASQDKRGVGARVAWAGVGVDLRTGTPTRSQVAAAVRAVLGQPAYRRNAERIAVECASHDSPTEAAELLEALATG